MRRIGKTTTISMLETMARGNRNLFNGYYVNTPESPFQIGKDPFSVIRLDFSGLTLLNDIDGITKEIADYLRMIAKRNNVVLPVDTDNLGNLLFHWIGKLRLDPKLSPRVILLIDEYDASVTYFLPYSPDLAGEVAKRLKPFYEMIKKCHNDFHKVFITGVSKFANSSMFSGPNQFRNITKKKEFSTLFGFTDSEIRGTYGDYIRKSLFISPDELFDNFMGNLRHFYNGYRFTPSQSNEDKVFNPWSVLCSIDIWDFNYEWTETAPSHIVVEILGLHGIMKILEGFQIKKK
jgi:hypothetical protein